jgi:hypothetical protein
MTGSLLTAGKVAEVLGMPKSTGGLGPTPASASVAAPRPSLPFDAPMEGRDRIRSRPANRASSSRVSVAQLGGAGAGGAAARSAVRVGA